MKKTNKNVKEEIFLKSLRGFLGEIFNKWGWSKGKRVRNANFEMQTKIQTQLKHSMENEDVTQE